MKLSALLLVLIPLTPSCAEAAPVDDNAPIHADDLSAASPGSFDASRILEEPALFGNSTWPPRAAVERFLERTPYKAATFLYTHTSNGITALDAVMAAAKRYRISPLVFLTFAEVEQGLIAERNHPFPASRVVRAFRCPVDGFDQQVDCLGALLRERLDAILAQGATADGWGPGIAKRTTDAVEVVPADAATAALYSLTPTVGEGKTRGVWLFWNVFQKFAIALSKNQTERSNPAPPPNAMAQ